MQNDTAIGYWAREIPLYGTTESTHTDTNPIFTTGVNCAGLYAIAPSASVMQVGDSADEGSIDTLFSTHIIRYAGMQPLPDGEVWGYPLNSGQYPLAGFHFAGDGHSEAFSLCFEDRDGVEGLHRYYDDKFSREAECQYMTLTLRLSPLDVERLLYLQHNSASSLSSFRLVHNNEQSLFLLESLQEYSPATREAKCRFMRLTKDY